MPDKPRHQQGLLDTSVVIDLEKLDPAQLPIEVAVSALTMAELAAGPHATSDPEERAEELKELDLIGGMEQVVSDLDALVSGVEQSREITSSGPIAQVLDGEWSPGRALEFTFPEEPDAEAMSGEVVSVETGHELVFTWETDSLRLALEEHAADEIDRPVGCLEPVRDPLAVVDPATGVAAASRGKSLSLDWLLGGPNTLYLCAPIEDQQRIEQFSLGFKNDLSAGLADAIVSAAPDVRVLATSREVLRLTGEFEYVVPPLAVPDTDIVADPAALTEVESVALLVDRTHAGQPSQPATFLGDTARFPVAPWLIASASSAPASGSIRVRRWLPP